MCSLQLADFIQIIIAAAALGIAFITWWNGRKIATLSDVLQELKRQTVIHNEMLNHNLKLTEWDRTPRFAVKDAPTIGNRFKVPFVNVGIDAESISAIDRTIPKKIKQFDISSNNCKKGDRIVIDTIFQDGYAIDDIAFTLYYQDIGGNRYTQEVTKVFGDTFRITEPVAST